MPISQVDTLLVQEDVGIFSVAYQRSAVSSVEQSYSLALNDGADDGFAGLMMM